MSGIVLNQDTVLSTTQRIKIRDEVIPISPYLLVQEVLDEFYKGNNNQGERIFLSYFNAFVQLDNRALLRMASEALYQAIPKASFIQSRHARLLRLDGRYEEAKAIIADVDLKDPLNAVTDVEMHFITFYEGNYRAMIDHYQSFWTSGRVPLFKELIQYVKDGETSVASKPMQAANGETKITYGDLGQIFSPRSLPMQAADAKGKHKFMAISFGGMGDIVQSLRYLRLCYDLGWEILLNIPQSIHINPISPYIKWLYPTVKIEEFIYDFKPDFFNSTNVLLGLGRADVDRLIPPEPVPSPPDLAQHWQNWLQSKIGHDQRSKPLIGINVSGDSGNDNDAFRCIPLQKLYEAVQEFGTVIILNFNLKEGDKTFYATNPNFIAPFLQAENRANITILDTVALLDTLDIFISVDAFPAHLAGSQLKECWTLLYEPAEYRWLKDRLDYPWYPTMRLFRQKQRGNGKAEDWDDVLMEIRQALRLRYEISAQQPDEASLWAACEAVQDYTRAIDLVARHLDLSVISESKRMPGQSSPYSNLPDSQLPYLAKIAELASKAGASEMARHWWLALATRDGYQIKARLALIKLEWSRQAMPALWRELRLLEHSLTYGQNPQSLSFDQQRELNELLQEIEIMAKEGHHYDWLEKLEPLKKNSFFMTHTLSKASHIL